VLHLDYYDTIELSKTTRTTLESSITESGFKLGMQSAASYTLTIAVTDVSIIIRKEKDLYQRSVSLTLHINCSDHTDTITFSRGTTKTADDSIPPEEVRQTDNSFLFSPDTSRIFIGKSYTGLMAATLVVFSAALLYFAAQ
jgi:hypothetical protein